VAERDLCVENVLKAKFELEQITLDQSFRWTGRLFENALIYILNKMWVRLAFWPGEYGRGAHQQILLYLETLILQNSRSYYST